MKRKDERCGKVEQIALVNTNCYFVLLRLFPVEFEYIRPKIKANQISCQTMDAVGEQLESGLLHRYCSREVWVRSTLGA
jgi:hypothetical protein